MKNATLTTVILLLSSGLFAQKVKESQVPDAVKNAFKNQFAEAKEVEWEKEDGKFEVEFEVGETDYAVLYDAEGNIVLTEEEINLAQLPVDAQAYLAANYKGKKTKEAVKITDAQGNVTFEAEVKKKDILFTSEGKFIKEVKD